MLKRIYSPVLISGCIGDGHLIHDSKDFRMSFSSTKLDYINYKRNTLIQRGYYTSNLWIKHGSGFNQSNVTYEFAIGSSRGITELARKSKSDIIKMLDKESLILYFLDDGSFRKSKSQVHLYCNSFSVDEVNELIDQIYNLYPIKRCTTRVDRKRDGRSYPYLYMPVATAKVFIQDAENFLRTNKIYDMYYKTTLDSPSTTIKSLRYRERR